MLRLYRARAGDRFSFSTDLVGARFCARNGPSFDKVFGDSVDFVGLLVEALRRALPCSEDRRARLARDPLASSDVFRISYLL